MKIFMYKGGKDKRPCPSNPKRKMGQPYCKNNCNLFGGIQEKGLCSTIECGYFKEHPECLPFKFRVSLNDDIEDIEQAVREGKEVFAENENYKIILDSVGQYMIHSQCNDHYIGLRGRMGTNAERKLNMYNFFYLERCNAATLSQNTKGYTHVICAKCADYSPDRGDCDTAGYSPYYNKELLNQFLREQSRLSEQELWKNVRIYPMWEFMQLVNDEVLQDFSNTCIGFVNILEDKQ